MTGLWELLIRVSVLWTVGEAAAWVASRLSLRLACLVRVTTAAGMLAVPSINVWLPPQLLEVPGWRMPQPPGQDMMEIVAPPASPAAPPRAGRSPESVFALAYTPVAGFLLMRMVAGAWRLRRILRSSRPEAPPEASEIAGLVGLEPRHAVIRSSKHVVIPFTVGLRRHVILLPQDWREWPQGKLRSVLAHELAHAVAKDWLAARLAALNRVLYWFHPAAWWLERRLAAEAELCADRAALAVLDDRQSYVETILDFARALQARRMHGMEATAMARTSNTEKRIDKILSETRFSIEPLRRPALAALLAAAVPIVLAAALVVPVPQPQLVQSAAKPRPVLLPSAQAVASDQEAAGLEARLRSDPNDDRARFRLLNHYAAQGDPARARAHAMFLIEQRPETLYAAQATLLLAGMAQRGQVADDIGRLAAIWRGHVADRPDSARVLANAARVLSHAGMLFEAESLLQRARRLEPAEPSHASNLASLYAGAILGSYSGSEEFLSKARAELAGAPDATLLAHVAEILLAYSGPKPTAPGNKTLSAQLAEQRVKEAEKYLRRALLLDPENEAAKKWMAMYESRLKETTEPPRRITVASGVQQVLLLEKPEAVYPAAAREAGVQGSVVFRAVIGADGWVKSLQLVSGPPALVATARDAAMKYRYRPTLLNGEPVEVETQIEIPFRMPEAEAPQVQLPVREELSPSELTSAPMPVVRVQAELTSEARAARAQGIVLLEFLIDEAGNVKEPRVLRGLGMGLDEKAVEAILQWKFKPGFKDGRPVPVRTRMEMKFHVM